MLYRLQTEFTGVDKIKGILNKRVDGWTMLKGIGSWKGKEEDSLTIEIVTDKPQDELIIDIANEIKRANWQEAVLVQKFDTTETFV